MGQFASAVLERATGRDGVSVSDGKVAVQTIVIEEWRFAVFYLFNYELWPQKGAKGTNILLPDLVE